MLSIAGVAICLWSAPDSVFGDEGDLIRPARDHARGIYDHRVKYPSFALHLYGQSFRLAGVLEDFDACLRMARVLNALLFGLGIVLSYAVARRLISARGALVAALLFATTPVIMVYAPYVKTEPVLIVETLLCMYAVLRVAEEPSRLRWHALAGLCAGLAMATKISVYPGLMYAAWLLVNVARRSPPAWHAVGLFVLVAITSMLVTWTNLSILPQMWDYWQDDPYFQPNASPFRAVPGLRAFPWDRYTTFFIVTLPLSIGWPMMATVAWSARLSVHRSAFGYAIGGATLVTLVLSLQATMLRVPHGFMTLYLWAVITSSVVIERLRLSEVRWRRAASVGALVSLLGMSAATIADLTQSNPEHEAERFMTGDDVMLLLYARSREPDRETIRSQVERTAPRRIVVMSSYLHNMCKYRDHALYEDNCRYYHALLAGETPFHHVTDLPMLIPLAFLAVDPDVRDARFLVFERDPTPASQDGTTEGFGR
ncbi:MAG: glycosyltransferase family 39 protein [Polyangiales bacterium]|nr:glycosyltransferase family 39 protein [Myxococcales bacterium]MCB9659624.1 glycosyltransferase family 39 protein [Sandaracinaceae bacterium]